MQILFVNACVRGEESNTKKLAMVALEDLRMRHPGAQVREVNLAADRPQALYAEDITRRDLLRKTTDLSDPMFAYAHQFAQADKIVVAAPYWDMSFPAVLKIYFELISVVGITFHYTADGSPQGGCRADELLYITSAGGIFPEEENMGFSYIQGLCSVYGIEHARCFALKGLEMGADIGEMVKQGQEDLRCALRTWNL